MTTHTTKGEFTSYNNKTYAILRVDNACRNVELRVAHSADGIRFTIEDGGVLRSDEEPYKTYELELYDPRISRFEDGTYYITYGIDNRHGVQAGISETRDFKTFEKIAIITQPNNRNVVLFPEKINGHYVRLDRPFLDGGDISSMWLSRSPDLVHWGQHQVVMTARPYFWDNQKIGAGAPPIETKEGWLEIYHGTTRNQNGWVYRIGAVLLDLDDPSKVISRGKQYLLSPAELYERVGDVPNVCFVCGVVPDYAKNELKLYYGCADTCTGLATARISDMIDFCNNKL